MDFCNVSIGTDIEDARRFENKTPDTDFLFLKKIFTDKEIQYCFSKGKSHLHLCARFCAKEAIVKALSAYNISDVYYSDIEILNNKDGSPYALIYKYPDISVKVTLSHSRFMQLQA